MKRLFLFFVLLVFVSGCGEFGIGVAKRTVRYPNQVTPEIKAQFDEANNMYMSKRFSDADAALENFLSVAPYTELTDEARFLRGEIAFSKKNYDTAIGYYKQAVSNIVSPKVGPKAYFKTALSFSKLGKPTDAAAELKKIDRRETSAVLKLRADSLGVKLGNVGGSNSIMWNLLLLDDYAEALEVRPTGIPSDELVAEDVALATARKWVGDKSVTVQDIENMPLKDMKGKRSGGFAMYKLALIYHTTGDTRAATKVLKSYVSVYPKHEYYGAARLLLTELGGAIGAGAGLAVGVIVPLSGKYAPYGESVLHGVECATGIHDPCIGPSGIKLIVKDSESITGGASAAVDELAANPEVVAIVGPLVSSGSLEAAQRAQALGIPMITVSQRSGLAEVGEFVFRNSVSEASEMNTLANHAVSKMQLHKFFILSPTSKKASEYRNLFATAVENAGGSVVANKTYSSERFSPVVESGDGLRNRGAAEFSADTKQEVEREIGDLSSGVSGFDAIFIPDSANMAISLVSRMDSEGKRAQLLGIPRWNNGNTTGLDDTVFVDSFSKDIPDEVISAFVSRFKQAYGTDPTMLEALGYDAMKLVGFAITEKGTSKRESIRNAIAKITNFPGITGKISFNSQGDANRQVWVLTVKGGSVQLAN